MAAFPRRTLMERKNPTLLLVLDGWGHAAPGDTNAITHAPAHHFLEWWETCPKTLLSASGREVGLPLGLMGNSEVGHTNLGAGRVVYQTITRIDQAIADGSFQRNAALRGAVEHAKEKGTRLHLFGLIGSGGVHASSEHYRALLDLAVSMGLSGERIIFHALLDGRDTPPTSAEGFLAELEGMLAPIGARVGTVCGRYFGMDRDTRWERTVQFWDALVHGKGQFEAPDAMSAYKMARDRGETDEFVQATVVGAAGERSVREGDAVLSFNFRADRVRQITDAFLTAGFDGFERGSIPKVHYVTMTQYRKGFACPIAYPPEQLRSLFGELVSARGLRQFRCAETEKYAHVTFFFNGGREDVYEGEERLLIPSPKVATYDLQPEMSANLVADAVVDRLQKGEDDLYVINFANADMVGHTGIVPAAEEAVRAVDACLARIVAEAMKQGGTVAITADHGNSEMMVDPVTGEPHTAHTINPVPFVLVGERFQGSRLRKMGTLADVAPTLMEAMGIDQPSVMDGRSLFHN